jgi:competence protein ComEC
MFLKTVPVWKEAPFIRLLVPLIIGITVQWHGSLPGWIYWVLLPPCISAVLLFSVYRTSFRFKNYWVPGIFIYGLLLALGGLLCFYADIRHRQNWFKQFDSPGSSYIISLDEPLTEKNNSYTATASLEYLCNGTSVRKANGHFVLYFKKDASVNNLSYPSRIVFSKELIPIRNSGNPGAFDYVRYNAFRQIFHQVFLKPGEYRKLPAGEPGLLKLWLFRSKEKIIRILQQFIPGKTEAGLAEALLIGYKNDLDKNLLQSYSNTGVVHVIAISGLHLGLIYWLLSMLLRPLGKKHPFAKWAKPLIIILGLWAFSLLAGGSASVLRSAVMFMFIVLGENLGRRVSVYNSLAGSAFLLLCFRPYWLWDAGFQLSYIAVLSIVVYHRTMYGWFFIKNRILDHIWNITAITVAAQVLTTPVSLYHFHQFPVYFLLTNLVAVPLSSLVVLGEILLCSVSPFDILAHGTGATIGWLIRLMNGFIKHIERLPFPTWENLLISDLQLLLLYLFIILVSTWLMLKQRTALLLALFACSGFFLLRSISMIGASRQKKLIVYNIPRHQAIDLISGRKYVFLGDSVLHAFKPLQQFYMKPSRVQHRVTEVPSFPSLGFSGEGIWFQNRRILVIRNIPGQLYTKRWQNEPGTFTGARCKADLVILAGNPRIRMQDLLKYVKCGILVFDSSNSARNISKWKEDCERSGVACYAVTEKGAFILNLN